MMNNTQKFKEILLIIVVVSPIAYLLFNWSDISDPMPSSTGGDGVAKTSKLTFVIAYSAITTFLYFLMKKGEKFLFKKSSAEVSVMKYYNLRLLLFIVIALMSLYAMNLNSVPFSTSGVGNLVVVGVMMILCNYFPIMTEPNYFIGIRFPWTVNSEYVWNKTHQHIGKIWFVISLVGIILLMFLPAAYHKVFFWTYMGGILVHSLIYSIIVAIQEQLIKKRARSGR